MVKTHFACYLPLVSVFVFFPVWAPFAVVLFSGYIPSQSCLLGPIPRGRDSHVMARGLLVYARHRVGWFTLVSSMELEQSRMRNSSLLYVLSLCLLFSRCMVFLLSYFIAAYLAIGMSSKACAFSVHDVYSFLCIARLVYTL